MLCRAGPWGPPTSAAGSQTQCGRSHAARCCSAPLSSPGWRAASPQPLPGFLFAWRGSPSPGGTEASPRPLPTAVVVKTQPQGPVQPGAAAGCDSRSSSRPRGASVCSFQARWTPKAACPPPRGRSVQLWPHHVVGAGGLLMRWPGGCLRAAMALCMPSRPPERAGFGVPGLAVPPAADPRRLRLF